MEFNAKYDEKEVIGKGNFGTAHLVTEKITQEVFVAKKIQLTNLSDKERAYICQEARLLSSVSHAHIVSCKEYFLENDLLVIVMEHCAGGDLSKLVKTSKEAGCFLPEELIAKWFTQLGSALQYLHSNKVLHRDIKSSNIYITSEGDLKIGDFGIAKILENTCDFAKTLVGTPYYMSPEVCENRPYTSKSDVWSLGCLFYELCTLRHPFTAGGLLELVMKILKDEPKPITGYSSELCGTIYKMLTKDMNQRPSLLQLLSEFDSKPSMLQEAAKDIRTSFHQNKLKNNIFQESQVSNISAFNPCDLEEKTYLDVSNVNPLDLVGTLTECNFCDNSSEENEILEYSNSNIVVFEADEFQQEINQTFKKQDSDSEYSDDFESEDEEYSEDDNHESLSTECSYHVKAPKHFSEEEIQEEIVEEIYD